MALIVSLVAYGAMAATAFLVVVCLRHAAIEARRRRKPQAQPPSPDASILLALRRLGCDHLAWGYHAGRLDRAEVRLILGSLIRAYGETGWDEWLHDARELEAVLGWSR